MAIGGMEKERSSADSPKIVGLFGVPGSGKTTLIRYLKANLSLSRVEFFEGSDVIAREAGGLEAFKNSSEDEKLAVRQRAVLSIQQECIDSNCLGVVTGHFSFWPEANHDLEMVLTEADLKVYTHILYLDTPADVVRKRIHNDSCRRERERVSTAHCHCWQEAERKRLRELCYQNGILFSLIEDSERALHLINSFHQHDAKYNAMMAIGQVTEAVSSLVSRTGAKPDAMLVIDGDKTLAAEDTGELFWKQAMCNKPDPLHAPFQAMGYSYACFRQIALLYHEVGKEETFDALCAAVASQVDVHPDFITLLLKVAKQTHVGAMILTCGLRLVWQKVLSRLGLSDIIRVVGNGPVLSGCVVTPDIKADVVKHLQDSYHTYVWAFGDSPLDLPMLKQADQAIIVVGELGKRSKSMDAKLQEAIDDHHLQARQVLLPSHSSPRLDISKLPVTKLTELGFMQALHCEIRTIDATMRTAAKLLMTPTRDAGTSGPSLREAHRAVGRYLAIEFLSDLLGVQEKKIPHVQGGSTNGYRLFDESSTTIIALMRGGEAMAFGVSDIFPRSVFLHAKQPKDVDLKYLARQSSVILVDSVVNNGETVTAFVQHLRRLRRTVRIVIVAGVVQIDALREGALLQRSLAGCGGVDLVALRISHNKYTGKGKTDTGARMFHTTHLEP